MIIFSVFFSVQFMEIEFWIADACYGDFLACLKDAEDHNENRYGIYDYPYDKDGQHKTKMVFYSW